MRVARQSTVGWGVVQIGVALGRAVDGPVGARRRPARCCRSPRGPVLGAFLVGVLTRGVGSTRDADRHGRPASSCVVVAVVDGRRGVDLVRVRRRGDDVDCRARARPALRGLARVNRHQQVWAATPLRAERGSAGPGQAT